MAKELKLYSVDTLIRRRFHVDALNKREATTLAMAVLDGRLQANRTWEQYDIDGSEILAGIYETPANEEEEE